MTAQQKYDKELKRLKAKHLFGSPNVMQFQVSRSLMSDDEWGEVRMDQWNWHLIPRNWSEANG